MTDAWHAEREERSGEDARLKPKRQAHRERAASRRPVSHKPRSRRDPTKLRGLSPVALKVLTDLSDSPQRAGRIRPDLSHNERQAALAALQRHGLAERVPQGWKLTD